MGKGDHPKAPEDLGQADGADVLARFAALAGEEPTGLRLYIYRADVPTSKDTDRGYLDWIPFDADGDVENHIARHWGPGLYRVELKRGGSARLATAKLPISKDSPAARAWREEQDRPKAAPAGGNGGLEAALISEIRALRQEVAQARPGGGGVDSLRDLAPVFEMVRSLIPQQPELGADTILRAIELGRDMDGGGWMEKAIEALPSILAAGAQAAAKARPVPSSPRRRIAGRRPSAEHAAKTPSTAAPVESSPAGVAEGVPPATAPAAELSPGEEIPADEAEDGEEDHTLGVVIALIDKALLSGAPASSYASVVCDLMPAEALTPQLLKEISDQARQADDLPGWSLPNSGTWLSQLAQEIELESLRRDASGSAAGGDTVGAPAEGG